MIIVVRNQYLKEKRRPETFLLNHKYWGKKSGKYQTTKTGRI
jgi:hypothetical protein